MKIGDHNTQPRKFIYVRCKGLEHKNISENQKQQHESTLYLQANKTGPRNRSLSHLVQSAIVTEPFVCMFTQSSFS